MCDSNKTMSQFQCNHYRLLIPEINGRSQFMGLMKVNPNHKKKIYIYIYIYIPRYIYICTYFIPTYAQKYIEILKVARNRSQKYKEVLHKKEYLIIIGALIHEIHCSGIADKEYLKLYTIKITIPIRAINSNS